MHEVGHDFDTFGFLGSGQILIVCLLESNGHLGGITHIARQFSQLGGFELAWSVTIDNPANIGDAIPNGVILCRWRGEAKLNFG